MSRAAEYITRFVGCSSSEQSALKKIFEYREECKEKAMGMKFTNRAAEKEWHEDMMARVKALGEARDALQERIQKKMYSAVPMEEYIKVEKKTTVWSERVNELIERHIETSWTDKQKENWNVRINQYSCRFAEGCQKKTAVKKIDAYILECKEKYNDAGHNRSVNEEYLEDMAKRICALGKARVWLQSRLDFADSEKKRKEKNAFIKTWGYDPDDTTNPEAGAWYNQRQWDS
jgi:DNA-binding ferritin-like protein (Dps family)